MIGFLKVQLRRARFICRLLVLAVLGFASLFVTHDADAARKRYQPPIEATSKYAAIVIDAATGEVLKSAQADQQRHPASLTKMMTMLLVFDALAEGRVRPTDYIRISNFAANMSPSKLGIKPGGRLMLDHALRAVSVKSANDIAVALAEALAGSESRFAQRMNLRARSIGMTATHFVNASGLHNSFQVTTARDMAILARYIIATYPRYYRYFGLRSFSYAGRTNSNHNKLMNNYDGMDGMKTGYISQSGFNLVASARHGDRRLIGVVFGGRTAKARDDHMAKILDTAFLTTPRLAKPKLETAKLPGEPPLAPNQVAAVQVVPPSEAPSALEPAKPAIDVTTSPFKPGQVVNGVAIPERKPILAPAAGVLIGEPPSARILPLNSQSLGVVNLSVLPPAAPVTAGDRAYTAQIGAYQNRDATDRALYIAMQKLPVGLKHATPMVAPLKSVESGWLFRARLGNLSQAEARRVCQIFTSCLVLAPEKF